MPASTRRTPVFTAAKVPEITALFWAVKVLTTGMGEAASDWLGEVSIVVGGAVGVLAFVLAMWLQLRSSRYSAPTYWFAVSMVAVFGTMAADVVHVVTGLPYTVTTALAAALVAVLFVLWYRSEGTVSIHAITTPRREWFYWATVLATFALGTAAGDLVGIELHLGFLDAGLLFGVAILVPLVAWRLGVNPVLSFWTAYVLTRPLGASFADWLGKSADHGGGPGLGDGTVAGAATVVIAVLVLWLARSGADVQRSAQERAVRPAREPAVD